ncbi:endo-polygalacturonase [uncultured Muribaculum sp.]|uniref:endo-polygalacturonase n=1 Tax=uncultured Muribaculum sp. TaxID=1918613 RepID=UPI0025E47446|nr:endo-polygalacturonase [uncultured Muribaculum sp.]
MKYAAISLSMLLAASTADAELVSYPAPAEARLNESFSVAVRQDGAAWTPVPVYNVKVDKVNGTGHKVVDTSMAYFDMDGMTEVRVVSHNKRVENARVRPGSRGISCTLSGDTITFSIDRPELLSVEVNGDIFDNLQLFANPIDRTAPTPKQLKKLRKNKNYIYFGPGYHKIDTLKVSSGQEVYIAGGALVDGVIEVEDADGARVHGRGMVYPHRKMGLAVRNSRNVEVEGLFSTQCAVGGSDSVKIENVKVMSYYGWGDGFNVFASNNVHYDHIFARTSDDCTTIYATRKGFTGGCRNIVTENSVLWADVAHPFMIGLHGNVEHPDVIEDCIYRNIDVLDMQEKQIDYQGVFAIVAGDNNTVRRITFEDIRVDNFRQGKLFDIRIAWNKKYCGAPGMAIEDITFNDIIYNGDRSELSLIIGYDDTRMVRGVHFNNLVINGEKIHDKMPGKPGWYKTADMGRIFIGEHTADITFSE